MGERRRPSRLRSRGCSVLSLACFLPARSLPAQRISSLHDQSWSTEQGLPQNSVHQVFQDHTGFVWVATEGGIARFDGVSFRVFDHQHEPAFVSDDACCVAEARNKDGTEDLWIGTADGLIRVHNERFERLGERDGLPSPVIRALLPDADGSLLVLTAAGLVRRRVDRFEAVPEAPPDIDSLAPAEGGGVWLLSNGRVFLLKNGALSPSPVPATDEARVKGIAGAPGAPLWSFTSTEVESRNGALTQHWRVGKDLPGSRVESLLLDRAGAAWIGTDDGLAVVEKGTTAAVEVPSLRGNSVLQTFEDREGNDWVGTESSGLHLLRSLPFRTLPGLMNRVVTAIVQSTTGVTWLGTRRDGLLRVQHGAIDAPVRPNELTSPLILSLAAAPDGSVWAGTPDGLNHITPQGKVQRFTSADGLPDDYIQALAADRDGCVWVGTRQGLAHLCGTKIDVQTKANGLSGDLVGTLLLARNRDLWIGTSGGLSRRAPAGRLTTFAAPRDLPPGIVSAMADDVQGDLWIATRNSGLSRLSGDTVSRINAQIFNADILGMAADNQGYLWLTRERGVDRVAIAALDGCTKTPRPCSPEVSHYGVADGLPTEEMTPTGSPPLGILQNGEVWIGTRRGVGIADPAHLPRNPVPPGVAIESFLIDDVAPTTGSGPLNIPYGGLRFTIEYAGLSFVAPAKVRYRFRLEGFDSAWTEVGARRSATYTNLPPRRYTFRVQAMNNDGVWNRAGATLAFRIVPPFYRRWWFLALAALALAALAIGLYSLRLRRLRAQFAAVLKERNRMARELHDTLAQDFVGVTLQLDLIAQLLGMRKLEAALQQVQQARKLVTEGLAEARQSIWELRANSATDSLPTRLGRVVERYSGDRPVIRTRIGGAFRPLDRRTEAEVLRVAQEALSNVQRHAHASNASLELHYGRDTLTLTIEDDGRGFDVEQALQAHERYGLSGLRERASLLGGTLDIASAPGKGTKITLTTEISRDLSRGREQAP